MSVRVSLIYTTHLSRHFAFSIKDPVFLNAISSFWKAKNLWTSVKQICLSASFLLIVMPVAVLCI